MAKQAQLILDEVRVVINDTDEDNFRWSDDELLDYMNAAGRQIVTLLPESNIVEEEILISAGSDFRQALPAGGVKFIKVANNYDTVAGRRGPPLRYVELDAMDSHDPLWGYNAPSLPTINNDAADVWYENYMHDPREPKVYYLWPRPDAATAYSIMLVYCKLPTETTSLGANYGLADEYVNATIEYMTFRALSKDGRQMVSPDRQKELWDNFLRFLGLKPQVEERVGAQANRPPEGP